MTVQPWSWWTEERTEQLRRYLRQGLSDTIIAKRLGTTPGAVNGKRLRMGQLTPRGQRIVEERARRNGERVAR
jgi:hypothetical protein